MVRRLTSDVIFASFFLRLLFFSFILSLLLLFRRMWIYERIWCWTKMWSTSKKNLLTLEIFSQCLLYTNANSTCDDDDFTYLQTRYFACICLMSFVWSFIAMMMMTIVVQNKNDKQDMQTEIYNFYIYV